MTHPILLRAERVHDRVQVTVVAAPDASCAAEFELNVSAGGNLSVHRGSARVVPGSSATLSSVAIGPSGEDEWRATLKVRILGGASYELSLPNR
jgi:hypothetical protein